MIPKSRIFISLRSKALDFYPEKCQLLKRQRITFGEWIQKGAYNPTSATSSEIIIEASPHDIGSILLSDVEYYLNNCYEHIQECLCFSIDDRIRSDAWNIVNIYYFGFYVAQGLLRLLGNPIIFVNKESLQFLKKLTGLSVPGSGTFSLKKTRKLSETIVEYKIKQQKSKLHEATWKQLFNILQQEIINNGSDANEALLYKALTTKILFKIYNNYEWPSRIRNRANYIPGLAYCLVEKQIRGKSRRLIENWRKYGEKSIISNLNSSIASCMGTDENDLASHVYLLHDISHSLFILFRELYFELIRRRHLDLRMETKRKEFLKGMALSADDGYHFTRTI